MHTKLGLFKNFVQALDQDDRDFRYLQQNFQQRRSKTKNWYIYWTRNSKTDK